MTNKPCRKELLHWINVVSFAVDDVKLFLDTHPTDEEALAYFQTEIVIYRVPVWDCGNTYRMFLCRSACRLANYGVIN